jgi:hypothetical protein
LDCSGFFGVGTWSFTHAHAFTVHLKGCNGYAPFLPWFACGAPHLHAHAAYYPHFPMYTPYLRFLPALRKVAGGGPYMISPHCSDDSVRSILIDCVQTLPLATLLPGLDVVSTGCCGDIFALHHTTRLFIRSRDMLSSISSDLLSAWWYLSVRILAGCSSVLPPRAVPVARRSCTVGMVGCVGCGVGWCGDYPTTRITWLYYPLR